jgi:hypothetical protein
MTALIAGYRVGRDGFRSTPSGVFSIVSRVPARQPRSSRIALGGLDMDKVQSNRARLECVQSLIGRAQRSRPMKREKWASFGVERTGNPKRSF